MSEANAAQGEFWSGAPGRRWVRHHADLDRLHDGVCTLLMTRAAPAAGARVLDVGCGGGATTRAAARAAGPAGRVHGIDLSPPLLALAERQGAEPGAAPLRFFQADAQTHRLETGYDVVLSRFGVMFFDDPVAAFANLRRALRPGGRLVFAAWADAAHNPYFATTRSEAMARLGAPEARDPDAPGPMAFRDPARIRAILSEAGFENARIDPVDVVLYHPDGWAAAERLLPEIGPIASILRDRGGTAEDLRAILSAVQRRWARYLGPDGLRLPGRVNLTTATA